MKMTFRWYGENDFVTLEKIRQIPSVKGIASAVYDTPPGEAWPVESIDKIKSAANKNGLEFEVVESVPVHEDIKLGKKNAVQLIGNYCENIRRLGSAGVKVICYNFMPVFDWLRSELALEIEDGSFALAYEHEAVLALDPANSELSLPGWDESYSKQQLRDLLDEYKNIDRERLWDNLTVFLKAVIPVAEEYGIKMAIHPDDPPWDIFGLPRIITNAENIQRLINTINSSSNCITFCTGSLGSSESNKLPDMIRRFGDRIAFVHLRNILITGEKCFRESAHPSEYGSLDMYEIIKALYETGFDGYIRPDHGRMIWGETGRPGYGLYDRALGAAYLTGVWEAVAKNAK